MSTLSIGIAGTRCQHDSFNYLHCDDGPAVIYADGHQRWYLNDKLHRTDGPAVIYPYGKVSWWLHYRSYGFEEWLEALNISDETKVMMKLKYG
jgi:hypothetical protein